MSKLLREGMSKQTGHYPHSSLRIFACAAKTKVQRRKSLG